MEVSNLTAATAFSDSDNSSGVYFAGGDAAAGSEFAGPAPPGEVEALRRLSDNFGAAFLSPELAFCVDAHIALGGGESSPSRVVGVHRCVLSARSPYFRNVFAKLDKGPTPANVELRELVRDVEVGYEALALVLGYLYSGKVAPLPKAACTCVDEECGHEACRPAVDFIVEVLYASYTFQIFELVNLFQRHLLDILDKVEIDDVPVVLCVANLCGKSCARLLSKCIDIVVQSDLDIVSLEKTLPPQFVKEIMDSRINGGLAGHESIGHPGKHIRRIYRALDSDDVELVRMLLKEGSTTLDDSCALHYAVAHCDSKITTELLDLGLADVNHKNTRGYAVLHVASPWITISRPKKGRIHLRTVCALRYWSKLENRVALARVLFPMEAKVAMDIAQVGGTLEFTMDLNETPFMIKEEHIARMKALSRTGNSNAYYSSKELEDS